MILKNFNGFNSIYKLSFDQQCSSMYSAERFNVLFVDNDKVNISPDNVLFNLEENEQKYLQDLGEGACIEISKTGKISCAFGMVNDNTLYITDKCNSNCIMCPMAEPARKFGNNTPIPVIKELIKYMPCNMEHITITGGEPFIIKEQLFEILNELKVGRKANTYLLLSNGRIFANHEYCKLFAESVPEDFLIGIPLHGPNATIHDLISQTPGSFLQTTNGITNLLNSKSTSIEIRIVINKINAPYMMDIAKLIIEKYKGINSVKFMGMEMLGNAIVNSDKVWISYSEAFTKIRSAIDFLVENLVDVEIYNFPLCFVDPAYWHICAHSISAHKVKYADSCIQCKEKKSCGGMFTGTDKYLADAVNPIK